MITKWFKTILDDKIKEVLTSGPKQYNHPNESILLPAAAPWTSSELPTILTPTAHGSTSTLRALSPLVEERNMSKTLSSSTDMPFVSLHTAGIGNINLENIMARSTAQHPNDSIQDPSPPEPVSLVTITQSKLPYTQSITLATPSLYVCLDTLSITIEFVRVLSGRLTIVQTEGVERSKELRIVDIKDIPTTSELQVHCLQDSREVGIQLRDREKGVILVAFVLEEAC